MLSSLKQLPLLGMRVGADMALKEPKRVPKRTGTKMPIFRNSENVPRIRFGTPLGAQQLLQRHPNRYQNKQVPKCLI